MSLNTLKSLGIFAFAVTFLYLTFTDSPPRSNHAYLERIKTSLQHETSTLWEIPSCKVSTELLGQRSVKLVSLFNLGTGLLLDESYVLTAAHVVEGAESSNIEVTGLVTDVESFVEEVVAADPEVDLALLRLNKAYNIPAMAIAPKNHIGAGVLASFVQGNKLVQVTLNQSPFWDKAYKQIFPEQVIPGDSGSVILTCEGEIAGVTTAIAHDCEQEQTQECILSKDYMFGIAVNADSINHFLQNYWPNYKASPAS